MSALFDKGSSRGTNVDGRQSPVELFLVGRSDRVEVALHEVFVNEVDGASAKAPTHHPRAENFWILAREIDQEIEFFAADFIFVLLALMRSVEEFSKVLESIF